MRHKEDRKEYQGSHGELLLICELVMEAAIEKER